MSMPSRNRRSTPPPAIELRSLDIPLHGERRRGMLWWHVVAVVATLTAGGLAWRGIVEWRGTVSSESLPSRPCEASPASSAGLNDSAAHPGSALPPCPREVSP
jgi:hypothetical protein